MKHILHIQLITLLAAGALALRAGVPAPAQAATATEVEPGTLVAQVLGPPAEPGPGNTAEAEGEAEPGARAMEDATPPGAGDGGALSLDEALSRALAAHPGLAALDKEYWARDSIAWQEGRKPNPELELELEEFGGTQEALGVRAMATTLTYTQPVERGGKRGRRETAAALERELVLWDVAELEHEIQAGVRTAYGAVQSAQYELEQLGEYRALVQRIYDTVALSVEAGRSARLELERFEIELSRLDLEVAVAERNLDQARLELAGTWGGQAADFTAVGTEGFAPGVPPLAQLRQALDSHPALARYDAEYETLCARLDLEHANAAGDMQWFGGVSRLNEIDETVFNVGLAWDLTTNDKNEGNISAAARRLEQVEDLRGAVRLGLERELAALHNHAANALSNYEAYGAALLPAANEALALTEEGYRYGKFELLDVLDAQRTVLELEREQTAALNALRSRLAEIEALLGTDIEDLPEAANATASTAAAGSGDGSEAGQQDHNHE